MYMDSVGKVHTYICTFQCVCVSIYVHIFIVLIMLIYFELQGGTEQCGK